MNKRYSLLFTICILIFLLAACGDDSNDSESSAPTADLAPRARVTVSEAMIFQYPSRESVVVSRLFEGDQVAITGHTEPDELGYTWYRVGYGDHFGWVVGSQVEVSGDVSATRLISLEPPPTVELPPTIDLAALPTVTASPEPGQVYAVVTEAEAIVRSQPAATAAELLRLPMNEQVDIIGRVEPDEQGNVYYFVARAGTVLGWVSQAELSISGDAASVPIVEDALTAVLPTEAAQIMTPASSTPEAVITVASEFTETAVSMTASPATPSRTPDVVSTAQAAPTATNFPEDDSVAATVEPSPTPGSIREGVPPPLSIELPEGWQVAHLFFPINTVNLQGELAISMYRGPLMGDSTGTIWLIYGFPNIVPLFASDINLYGDAVQLLRAIIIPLIDPDGCTVGLGTEPGEPPRTYTIGGHEATGTIYSAAPCANSSDVSGFFAALQVENVNFAFFVGVEPVQPPENVSRGLRELEAILDTVEFELSLPTEEPEAD